MKPDIEAIVYLFSTNAGGRSSGVRSGYRPHHNLNKNFLTSGNHEYIDTDILNPGEYCKANITFVSPEEYPRTLSIGTKIDISEGSKTIGYAEVTAIYNDVLDSNSNIKIVECITHGNSRPVFICTHLTHGSQLGWIEVVVDDPDDEFNGCRNAWCNKCEEIRIRENGWNDISEEFARPSFVCSYCALEIERQNKAATINNI